MLLLCFFTTSAPTVGKAGPRGRPAIRDQVPVLIDDDLRFEDGCGPNNPIAR